MSAYIDAQRKILRWPHILERIQDDMRVAPMNIEMDLSNRCQLHCRLCDFAHIHDQTLMPLELAERIIDQMASMGVMAVTFSGGGEPTMNPYFREIVLAASNAGLQLGLYTNGIEGQAISEVAENFAWVYISLDAVDAASYERYKGGDYFDQVQTSIIGLVGVLQDTTIGIGFLLDAENAHQIKEMVALADQMHVAYVQIRPRVGLASYQWVPEALPLLEFYGAKDHVYVPLERFVDLWENWQGLWERGYTICRGSELTPCIGAGGQLWVCPNMRGLRLLGDLNTETLAKIWERREVQIVGEDCRIACRNHNLNITLDYVCRRGPHSVFI